MDWIHQNATAVIAAGSALSSALIAGGFALLGAWLNNRQNFQRQKQIFEHENQKENRKNLTEKGEELYVLLSKWSKNVSIYQLNLMHVANGNLTRNQVNEMVINQKVDYDFDRVGCLLEIYFPELKSAYKNVDKARNRAVKIGHDFDHGKISAQACFKGVGETATIFDKAIEDLLNDLTNAIMKKIN